MKIKRISYIVLIVFLLVQMIGTSIIVEAAPNTNLVKNGDFSDGLSGWSMRAPGEGATVTLNKTEGVNGSACAYVDKAQGAGDLLLPISWDDLNAGDVLQLTAKLKLKGDCPNGKTTSTAKWCSKDAVLDTTGVTVKIGSWTTVSYTYVLTDKVLANGMLMLRASHPGTTDYYNGGYYIDDVVVVKSKEGSFFGADKRWEYDEDYIEETDQSKNDFVDYDNTAADKLAQVMAFKTGSEIMFARANRIDLGDGIRPVKVNSTVMIPLRVLADSFTMMVEWDNLMDTVTVYDSYYQLKCRAGSDIAEVLDFTTRKTKSIKLSVAAQTIKGVLYFPADAFCNVFGKFSNISNDGLVLIGDESINFTEQEKQVASGYFEESLETINLYVSLDGNDENDGTKASPFKTLEKARDFARNYRDKNVVVNVAEGEYELDRILDFTTEDSKLGMARTTFKGDGDVIINGGTIARGWEACGEMNGVSGIYRLKMDSVRDYTAIYEDGVMSVQARYPNVNDEDISSSYLAVIQEPFPITGKSNAGPLQSFLYDELPELANPSEAYVRIWPGGESGAWRWHYQRHQISSIDTTAKKVTLATNAIYTLGTGSAYHIENDINLLDVPGEFYVDKAEGYIYYYPRDKKNLENNVVFPVADGVIRIKGTNEEPVCGLEFVNLSIRNSDSMSLINSTGLRNTKIENCRIYSSGSYGISMSGYVQNNIIKGCEIFDVGHGGIMVSNGSTYMSISKYNRIENNHVYRIGRIVKNGYGIYSTHSSNTTITHNTVHDGPRFLISYSGGGNDGTITGEMDKIYSKHNLVAYNDLYNGMLESQDGGMLYNFRSWRNLNVSNRVHDSVSKNNSKTSYMIYEPIYNDDMTDYIINRYNLLDNNIEDDGQIYAAIRQKGAGGLVENNFVVSSEMTEGVLGSDVNGDGRAHGSYFYNNIGYTINTAPIYSRQLSSDSQNNILGADNNIFYNTENIYTLDASSAVNTLDELRLYKNLQLDKNTLTTDPKFVDYANNDFRLSYDSPAHALGTIDLNMRDMGVTSEFKFADTEEELKWLYVRFDGDTIDRSFRKLNIGESISLKVSARTKTGYFADLSNAKISYISDNKNIATVSESGVIKAVSYGTANIMVTVTKNGKSLSLPVIVIVSDKVSVKIKNDVTAIVQGETAKLEYTTYGEPGMVAGKSNVTYASASPDVIEISSTGVMIAKKTGESVITVNVVSGASVATAKKTFTVTDSDISEYNLFIEKQKIRVGETQPIEAWAVKKNGRIVTLNSSNSSITISDPKVAKVENNTFVGVGHGKVTVTLNVNYYGKLIKKSIEVFVVGADENYNNYHVLKLSDAVENGKIMVYNSDTFNAIHNGNLDSRPDCIDGTGLIMGDRNTIVDDWWVKRPEWVSYEKTSGVDNSPCLKVNGVGGDADLYQRPSALDGSLVSGKKYIMTAKVKLIDGEANGRFIWVYRHGFKDQVATWVTKEGVPLSTDEWTEVTSIFEYNGGTGYPDVALRVAGTASGYYLDDFGVYEYTE